MNYDALETEITDRLNSYFGSTNLNEEVLLNTVFEARRMPDTPKALLQSYSKSLVNVKYTDSTYGSPESTSEISQNETVYISCYIQADRSGGDNGAYRLLYHMKRALVGFRPTDSRTRMWIAEYGDWRIEDGQLQPYIAFAFDTISRQADEDEEETWIDNADTIWSGGPLAEVDSELYLPGADEPVPGTETGDTLGMQTKKIITAISTGNTLTDSFFADNLITEIVANKQCYIIGEDFTQSGSTITAITFGFYAGQKVIAKI